MAVPDDHCLDVLLNRTDDAEHKEAA